VLVYITGRPRIRNVMPLVLALVVLLSVALTLFDQWLRSSVSGVHSINPLLRWAVAIERPTWVIAPNRVYMQVAAGYGRKAVPLVAARPVLRPVRLDRRLRERVLAPAAVSLPVRRGDRLGEVRVFSGRTLVARKPLVAARAASAPGLFGKVGFYGSRTFSHIGGWFS